MNTSDTTDRLGELLTEPLAGLGLDLEAIDLSVAGKRRVLRIAVDRDGGVTMDDIAGATRQVSVVLDDSDAMGAQAYTLEVSSPGVDHPLSLPRHWRRNVHRLVKITRSEGDPLEGRIISSDDHAVVLDVAGHQQKVSYEEITKAKVQIEFKPFHGDLDAAQETQQEG